MDSIFKRYTWNKEWVRPYESLYSVLLNFCRVNTVNSNQALKLIGEKPAPSRSGVYNEIYAIYVKTVHGSIENFSRYLLPDQYVNGLTGINIGKNLYDHDFEHALKYCPQCLKESGYHATFYQLKGINMCPVHKVPMVICDQMEPYEIPGIISYFGHTGNLKVTDIPLPVERFKINEEQLKKASSIISANVNYITSIGPLDPKEADILPAFFNISKCDIILKFNIDDDLDMISPLIKEYKRLAPKLKPKLLMNKDEYNIYCEKFIKNFINDTQCIDLIEYICVLQLIDNCDLDSYPGNYPKLDLRQLNPPILSSSNENHIRIAYATAVKGCLVQWMCSSNKLLSPCANLSKRLQGYENLNLNKLSTQFLIRKPKPYMFLCMNCAVDLFWYQWKNYKSIVLQQDTFDMRNSHKKLPAVRYIIMVDAEENITIYRQVGEKY